MRYYWKQLSPNTLNLSTEIWEEKEEDLEFFNDEETIEDSTSTSSRSAPHTLTMWLVLFLLRLQSKHYVPDKAIDSLLKFLCTLFSVIGRFSELANEIAGHIPRTSYSLQRFADVARPVERFVVCEGCNSVYKPKD